MKSLAKIGLAMLVASVLAATVPAAQAMTVQPVVLDLQLSGRGMSQIIAVQNTFANPLPVELRVEELTFDEHGVKGTGKDPGDLLVFPPQALIQPGQTQSFRVQWVGGAALSTSKHYYVTVAQLPVKLAESESAIQVLYNFQVLVSVAPPGVKSNLQVMSARIVKDSTGRPIPVISIRDDSNAHGYVSKGTLRIVQKDETGKEIFQRSFAGPELQQLIGFGLVGAHQQRDVSIPVELPALGGELNAYFSADSR